MSIIAVGEPVLRTSDVTGKPVSPGGEVRELTAEELAFVAGGGVHLPHIHPHHIDWGRVGRDAEVGALRGAVTGGVIGAAAGGVGALPGATAGAARGALSGAVGSVVRQAFGF